MHDYSYSFTLYLQSIPWHDLSPAPERSHKGVTGDCNPSHQGEPHVRQVGGDDQRGASQVRHPQQGLPCCDGQRQQLCQGFQVPF